MRLARLLGLVALASVGCTGILGIADGVGYLDGGAGDGGAPPPDGAGGAGGGGGGGGNGNEGGAPDGSSPDGASCDPAVTPYDPHNCGACGHDCLGADCNQGVCDVIPIVDGGADLPYGIAVDTANLYWTISGQTGDGALYSCVLPGCSPTLLTPGTFYTPALYVAAPPGGDGLAFFTAVEEDGGTGALLADLNTNVGIAVSIAGVNPVAVAADDAHVYFSTQGTIDTCPLGAGACTPVPLPTGAVSPFNLAAYGGVVYWTDAVDQDVVAIPADGGRSTTLRTNVAAPFGVAADGVNVYYTNASAPDPGVYQCPLAGGGPCTTLATGTHPGNVAVDSQYVYFTDSGTGTIAKCRIGASCGASPTILATNQPNAFGIAVDATRVYWTNYAAGGSVLSVAK